MPSGQGLVTLVLLALPLLLLWWMVRSQKRRTRAAETFQSGLVVGDEVILTSGVLGTVVAVDGPIIQLEVSRGVVLRVDRRAVGGMADAITARPDAPTSDETTN